MSPIHRDGVLSDDDQGSFAGGSRQVAVESHIQRASTQPEAHALVLRHPRGANRCLRKGRLRGSRLQGVLIGSEDTLNRTIKTGMDHQATSSRKP